MSDNEDAHIDDIPSLEEATGADPDWKPVRIHFGIESFGVNAWVGSSRWRADHRAP